MSAFLDHLSADDSDIFDLLISARRKMTTSALLEIARDRGIFYSSLDSREEIARSISILPHAYDDIYSIVHRRDTVRRREKTTSKKMKAQTNEKDIVEAINEYKKKHDHCEDITFKKFKGKVVLEVTYNQVNYSKTKLLQREEHKSTIELSYGDETLVRFPANDKSKDIVSFLKNCLQSKYSNTIAEDNIELTGVKDPSDRSAFFTDLITKMNGFSLENVTGLTVSAKSAVDAPEDETDLDDVEGDEADGTAHLGISASSDESDDEDDEADPDTLEENIAAQEILAVVKKLALSGSNILRSNVYQELKKNGYYITSITWISKRDKDPYDVLHFYAGFEDKNLGIGFKYAVSGIQRFTKGKLLKKVEHVNENDKIPLFKLIEATARDVLKAIKEKPDISTVTDSRAAE